MLDRDYFFSFEGRAPRSEYWLFVAITFGYNVLVQTFILPIFEPLKPENLSGYWVVLFAISLPLFWPSVAIAVRRLHDRNKSSEWAWLFLGVPIIWSLLLLLSASVGIHSASLAYAAIPVPAITLWGFIELAFLRGTEGDNRFGPDPLPAVVRLPSGEKVYQDLAPGGYRVRLAVLGDDGRMRNEYYYVAESVSERARATLRDAKGARDEDVKTIDAILHETVERLNLKPGEFAPVPRAG